MSDHDYSMVRGLSVMFSVMLIVMLDGTIFGHSPDYNETIEVPLGCNDSDNKSLEECLSECGFKTECNRTKNNIRTCSIQGSSSLKCFQHALKCNGGVV